MTKQLIVTIPAGDLALCREIAQGVEPHADVRQSQNYADPATVKLVLDIVAQGVGIAGGWQGF